MPAADLGRDHTSALRSMKRYVAIALGDEYEVRLSREEGAFARPFARVWQVAGSSYPLSGGRWLTDVLQPYVISAYPPRARTPDDALIAAQRVEDTLYRAFRVGVGDGRACRVPLLNYENVPLNKAGSRCVQRGDFMRVNDISTQPFPDADDDKLWTVVCDVRLTWRRIGETHAPGPRFRGVRPRVNVKPYEGQACGWPGVFWDWKAREDSSVRPR